MAAKKKRLKEKAALRQNTEIILFLFLSRNVFRGEKHLKLGKTMTSWWVGG